MFAFPSTRFIVVWALGRWDERRAADRQAGMHPRFLQKLVAYWIRGPILQWISCFLTQRKMCVVVEGEKPRPVDVGSGSTARHCAWTSAHPLPYTRPMMNLRSDNVEPQIRFFADDCLLYRPINSIKDNQVLQQNLDKLQNWSKDWGMKFNTRKCYLLSSRTKTSYFYTVNDQIHKQVQDNPYLGLTISDNTIFIRFGSQSYKQIVGIPTGTNCAPLVADLFLFCYERDFRSRLSDNNQADFVEAFNSTSRYLDDLLNTDNPYFEQMVSQVYICIPLNSS